MFFLVRIFIANLKITCLAISCLLVFTADVRAEKSKVFWGGLGFSTFGDSSQTPSAEALRNCAAEDSLDRCGGHDIFEMSRDIFVSSQFDHLEVEARMLPFDQQIGNILSPTISSEFVIKGKVDGKFFYTFLVTGSLMIYEVEANKTNFISSVPFGIQTDEYFSKPLSKQEELDYFKNWYVSQDPKVNFFVLMADYARSKIDVPFSFSNGIQFTNIDFSDSVKDVLTRTNSLQNWAKSIKSFSETRLAARSGQPIIPSSADGSQLKLVFQDGSREIILRKPAYEFELYVAVFELQKPNAEWTCFNVGTFFTIRSAFEDEPILDVPIVHGEDGCANLPAEGIDETMFFPANLFEQIDSVMKAFGSPNPDTKYVRARALEDAAGALSAIKKFRKEAYE